MIVPLGRLALPAITAAPGGQFTQCSGCPAGGYRRLREIENGGSHSSMAGSAGKYCGDAAAPAMAASVPNLNTDSGAERFTAALVPWDIMLARS